MKRALVISGGGGSKGAFAGGVAQHLLETAKAPYDFFVGTDYAPALLARINKRLDYFAWAGTDLFDWPFYTSNYMLPHSWECDKALTAKLQLEGIRNCR